MTTRTVALSDVLDIRGLRREGTRLLGISAASPAARVLGPAFPVVAGDRWWLHRAIEAALPGEVLVVAPDPACGKGAVWDAGLTRAAQVRRIAGVVVAGRVEECEHEGWPVYASGFGDLGPQPGGRRPGELGEPITIGSVSIALGDMMVGDAVGVAHIARADLARCSVRRPGQAMSSG